MRADGLIAAAVLCLDDRVATVATPRASVRRRGVMATDIRKIVTIVEDVRSEAGRAVDPPVRRVVTAAVLATRSPAATSRTSAS